MPTDEIAAQRGVLGTTKDFLLRSATGVSKWLRTCADYYAAAAIYEELSRLSDAELHRRGLSRSTLARDICDRAKWRS